MMGFEIRKMRGALGMNYAEFAELVGVSTSTIYRWERGGFGRRAKGHRWTALFELVLLAIQNRVDGEGSRVIMLGRELRHALRIGGTLHGLAVLLEPWANRKMYGYEKGG